MYSQKVQNELPLGVVEDGGTAKTTYFHVKYHYSRLCLLTYCWTM